VEGYRNISCVTLCVVQPSVSFLSKGFLFVAKEATISFLQRNSLVADYRELVTELTLITLASADWKPTGDRQLVQETEHGEKLQRDGWVRV
jgi:hypothetical protein